MQIGYSQPAVQGLFQVHQYRIPPYQRGYAWELRNVDDFWQDVLAVGTGGHFLGPMVLHDPGGDDVREVIDGQQRLTTLQILLALIRDKYIELGDPVRDPNESEARCSAAPHGLILQAGYAVRFTLVAGDQNREVLQDFILRHPTDPKRRDLGSKKDVDGLSKTQRARNRPLFDARNRLREHLDTHLSGAGDAIERLKELERGLVRRVTVVVLDMSDLDDAFLLFETLNDRGLRLSAADLLKSHLLSRFDAKHRDDRGALDRASDKWDDMIDGLGGVDIGRFLRHYLLMRHERVRTVDVFPFFKKDVAKLGPDKSLEELVAMGGLYAELLRPPSADSDLFTVLTNLNWTSVDTHRIALLPARALLTKARFVQFARIAEVLSFRWLVTGGNAQTLESLYQEAASTLHESDGREVDAAQEHLVAALPSDKAFREGFAAESLGYAYVAAYALRRIELAISPGEKTIKSPSDVHVEHVVPKTPNEFWLACIGPGLDYGETVQRWGNLTLLLSGLNESIGNGVWDVKRYGSDKYPGYSASEITLTKDLLGLDTWTSTDIDLRARWLAVIATRVWSVASAASGGVDLKGIPASYTAVRADPTTLDPYWSPATEAPAS